MTRNIFFEEDPLFEEFALRPLIIDDSSHGPVGEVSRQRSKDEIAQV